MLNNLVNRHDARRLYRKVGGGDVATVVAKLRGSRHQRVVRQWSDTSRPPAQWWSVPAVRRRWNRMVTGDERVDFPERCATAHLDGATGLRALSIGCGTGGRELRWAELGCFDRIDAVDLSPEAVRVAIAQARAHPEGHRVHPRVGDATDLAGSGRYDVVIAEHSLHHLEPMPEVVDRIHDAIDPGGWFFVDEYVGPDRFQWTDAQVAAAGDVLRRLPEERRRLPDGSVKRAVVRPSRLWMLATDPSEACDSERIRPCLRERFRVVEERGYGGAVLHLALTDIAQNFLDDDAATLEVLTAAFAREDRLMAAGIVGSDFSTFACRPRGSGR